MPMLTFALDAPTVRYEPLGDMATTTGVPGEVSLEALRLCNFAADPPDHFNLLHFSLRPPGRLGWFCRRSRRATSKSSLGSGRLIADL
jgi:hypothetical protein